MIIMRLADEGGEWKSACAAQGRPADRAAVHVVTSQT